MFRFLSTQHMHYTQHQETEVGAPHRLCSAQTPLNTNAMHQPASLTHSLQLFHTTPPPSTPLTPKSSRPEQTSIPGHEIFLHLGHSRGSGGQVHVLVDGQAEGGPRDVQAARVAVVQAPTLPTGVRAVGQALAGAPAPNGRGSF